ncbi:MAG: DEAD/DEAH box helicase [Erysipelotrichales bacterium]
MEKFEDFNLEKRVLDALRDVGYEKPTPVQAKAITPILEGHDVLANAQTGTGKTAAFSLPILNDMKREGHTQALIVTPTRELAIQIRENIRDYSKYLKLKTVVIYGGVKQGRQVRSLEQGADVLIATPGRLLDLIDQGFIDLSKIKYFVLDEADNMLDMGFIHDIRKMLTFIPKKRQTLMFSATMPKDIKELASTILNNPVEVSVAPVSSAVDTVDQKLYYVNKGSKSLLLLDIMEDKMYQPTLIFTRTKHGADKLAKILQQNKFKVAAIHGNKSQNKRAQTLEDFKKGKINTLVATDVAARGLDIDDLSYVINYEIPNIAETYIHRIGRTGRAGKEGAAISLCDHEEKAYIKDIQKLMKKDIEVVVKHNYPLGKEQNSEKKKPNNKRPSNKKKPASKNNSSKSEKGSKKSYSSAKKSEKQKRESQAFKKKNKYRAKSNQNKKRTTHK